MFCLKYLIIVDRKSAHNITYTQAGVSCFVGQESSKFKVQFFVGKFSGKNPCLRIAENRYLQAKHNDEHRIKKT